MADGWNKRKLMLRINETCSCGANLKISGRIELVLRQLKTWRKNHVCIKQENDDTVTSGNAETQIAMGFQPGELPAKEYDPWEDE
jgi:hypothetical protein